MTHRLAPLEADCLVALPGIRHGFFTRQGGVSQGLYKTLNCGRGSKDNAVDVTENRARVAEHLQCAAGDIATPYQTHGATAIVVNGPMAAAGAGRADAIVSRTPGLAIGVLTADCAPVLLADAEAGIVAAAHAGWRGALAGVIAAAVATMESLGARRSRIYAGIGPSITQTAYEVGPEFEDTFLNIDAANSRFFTRPSPAAQPRFDLPAFVYKKLRECGLTTVEFCGPCTFRNESLFFSARRAQARSEADYGRQISAIVVT